VQQRMPNWRSDQRKPEKETTRSRKRFSEAMDTSSSKHRSIPLTQTA
jgi:hypothetical protein